MSRRGHKKSSPPSATPRSRFYVGFLVLCGVGALLSLDLMRVHINVHTNPDYQALCSVNEALDCEAVADSEYSIFGGLPVALWGLLGYVALASWAVWGVRERGAGETWPWGFLFGGAALFTLASLRLFAISHFVIHSVCLVCVGTYLVNLALLVVTFVELRRRGTGAFSALAHEVGAILKRPAVALIFLASLAGAVMILKASITPYWTISVEGPGGLPVGETAEGLPWIGATAPDVEIIEFSDYQCPHCLRGHNTMRNLVKANPERVRLVHRHYPLDQACNPKITQPFHVFACSYARLVWCAGQQGQFWEANDYVFQHGKRKDRVTSAELARQLELDAGDLATCESGRESAREIDHDLKAGRKVGVRGTPTFVMNGEVYSGAIPSEIIEAALGKTSAVPTSE